MRLVPEAPLVARTPETVAAGDVALRAAIAAVLTLLAAATLFASRPAVGARAAREGRPLPFAAAAPFDTSAWAGAELADGRLRVAARGANGVVATLGGSERWRDYTVRARLRWEGGRAVAVHVRDTGSGDFVACVLDGTTARIDEVRDGVPRTLATAPSPAYRGRAFDAVVIANGPHVGFAVDGRTLVTADVRARSGGVGLAAWDPAWDAASLQADYVRVERTIAALARRSPTPAVSPRSENGGSGE